MLVGVPNHRPDQDVNSDAFHSSRGHGSRTDFPTPMFMGKLPDMSVCDRVEKKVREMQKSGKGRAAPKGASPAWMSPDTRLSRWRTDHEKARYAWDYRWSRNIDCGAALASMVAKECDAIACQR